MSELVTLHLLSYETPDSIKGFSPYGALAKALDATLARLEEAPAQPVALVLRARLVILDTAMTWHPGEDHGHVVSASLTLTPHVSDFADIEYLKLYAADCRKIIMASLLAEIAKTIGA